MSWYVYPDAARTIGKAPRTKWLSAAPPWRTPEKWEKRTDTIDRAAPDFIEDSPAARRGEKYITTGGRDELVAINAALRLRRPLLVKGPPGIGKSSLAYSIAWRLGLGLPLRWEISSRTTLQDGLYDYDAVSHLHAGKIDIDRFITLGPLGTAMLPTIQPRVLLIDELDKATYDLPNDLLHVFEEGAFKIRELVRSRKEAKVLPYDHRGSAEESDDLVTIHGGKVTTHHHPVVVITTNDEREFPEAFLRRCVVLTLERPKDDDLAKIIKNWFGEVETDDLLKRYKRENTDVLLQALFLEQAKAPQSPVKSTLQRNPESKKA